MRNETVNPVATAFEPAWRSEALSGEISPMTSGEVVSRDHRYLELLQLCETVAQSRASVLITGEAGSGKKTLAISIHQKSPRANKPFQMFHCRELASGEQDSALKKSLELAVGGTLVLTEISKLSLQSQSRLYQAMQEGLDLRLIATTTRSLAVLVKQGEFREDLFYRLNVVHLEVPSLTERMIDIETLARSFARKWANTHGRSEPRFSEDSIQMLNAQRWPGNLRELESVIERAVLLNADGEIRARDLQIRVPAPKEAASPEAASTTWRPGRTLDEIERSVILEALKHHDGNRTHTAKALGISIRTLRNKLAEYRVMGIHA